ncbi:MAG TPA: GNAT family N-acetyltransferase [Candidatus Limnocylindrales bacterium]|nr:GNAT family N-acetyltransferase [Candidatus Limnocylindrales bacterium]
MPIPSGTIATGRLELVPLRIADADEMVAVLADPGLYAFIGGGPPTHDELVARFEAQVRGRSPDGREEWHNWVVRERPSGAATGFVQATVVDVGGAGAGRGAEIAWLIGVPWQGRGYASEAARGLVAWLEAAGVRSILAHVHPDHLGSAAVAERAGLAPTDELVDGERVWRRIVRASAGTGAAD